MGVKRCDGERAASEVRDGVPAMRDNYGMRRTYRPSFNRGSVLYGSLGDAKTLTLYGIGPVFVAARGSQHAPASPCHQYHF